MKSIACMLALALVVPGALVAQDTTAGMAPPPAAAAPAAPPAAPMLSVVEAAIGTSVVDRVPQDTGSAFAASVGTLVCWTKVSGGTGSVHHVWFHGDTQVGDMELQVGGSPWRTWSRKSVPADWTGPWHVEVRDAGGAVLKRLDFSVNASEAPAAPPAAAPAPAAPPPNNQ
jgi:hypothetical protein